MPKPLDPRVEMLLDVLGNETRRRILRMLAEEPKYFNQLSRELGVSQQAVLKHLDILEERGLITSYWERSDLAAPDRKYYRLSRSFYLTIGITDNLLGIQLKELEVDEEEARRDRRLSQRFQEMEMAHDAREFLRLSVSLLKELDREIQQLERRMLPLIQAKKIVMKKVREALRENLESDLERRVIYAWLNYGRSLDVEELADLLDTREREIREAIESIKRKLGPDLLN